MIGLGPWFVITRPINRPDRQSAGKQSLREKTVGILNSHSITLVDSDNTSLVYPLFVQGQGRRCERIVELQKALYSENGCLADDPVEPETHAQAQRRLVSRTYPHQ
jgi:hypothetical protein